MCYSGDKKDRTPRLAKRVAVRYANNQVVGGQALLLRAAQFGYTAIVKLVQDSGQIDEPERKLTLITE